MYCDFPILQRCCFCLPLRRGVLVVAYIKFIFSVFMTGLYSYIVHNDFEASLMYNGSMLKLPAEICVFMYCLECVFCGILIYGTHRKIILLLRISYYFSISTALMTILIQIVAFATASHIVFIIEASVVCFTSLCLELYVLILLWSLIKKWEVDGPHVYDNQLHQFINGEAKDANGVYNPSTVPVEV